MPAVPDLQHPCKRAQWDKGVGVEGQTSTEPAFNRPCGVCYSCGVKSPECPPCVGRMTIRYVRVARGAKTRCGNSVIAASTNASKVILSQPEGLVQWQHERQEVQCVQQCSVAALSSEARSGTETAQRPAGGG